MSEGVTVAVKVSVGLGGGVSLGVRVAVGAGVRVADGTIGTAVKLGVRFGATSTGRSSIGSIHATRS